jgi:hypothetical protein
MCACPEQKVVKMQRRLDPQGINMREVFQRVESPLDSSIII